MSPPHDAVGLAARYTPDDDHRRRLVAVAAGVGAVLAWYGATAVITGVKSGLVYNVVILVLLLATFVLPAYAAAALLSDDAVTPRRDGSADSVEALKRRYAAGEIDEATFQRRLDTLVTHETRDGPHTTGTPDTASTSGTANAPDTANEREQTRERTGH